MQANLISQTATGFDHAAVTSHVQILHERAAGLDGLLVVSVFNGNTEGTITQHRIGDVEGMTAAVMAHDSVPGANVYTGLHVMRRGLARSSRGGKADIVAVLGLVADMDADTGKTGELPLDASYIIESSPGNFQPAWLFDKPLAPAEAKPIAAALKAATGADHGTGDIDHVWRIPGTLNWPNPKKLARGRSAEPALVSISQPWTGVLYSAPAIAAALPAVKPQQAVTLAQLDELPDASTIAIDAESLDLLDADGQPDRSAHAARVVERLAFRGHSAEQSLALVLACGGAWKARYSNEAILRRDFERLWPKFADKHAAPKIDVSALVSKAANDNVQGAAKPTTRVSAEALLDMKFPPINYCVPGIVAEGLTLLAGRPKLGKSWLALNLAIAVATGGNALGSIGCEVGDAYYLALEDNQRRLKDRLRIVLPPLRSLIPDLSRLQLDTVAPRIDNGLIGRLDEWRTTVDLPRLIIIDTLAMVKPPKGKNQDSYAADYEAVSLLQRYASEHRLAVMLVTHVRKMEASDPLEMVSGTNGLTGAADTILVLDRDSDGPKLYGRGRDIEDVEKALRFANGKWSVLGNVEDVKRSEERQRIIRAVGAAERPLSPKEIAEATGMKSENVRYLLARMVEAGELTKIKHSYGPAATS